MFDKSNSRFVMRKTLISNDLSDKCDTNLILCKSYNKDYINESISS